MDTGLNEVIKQFARRVNEQYNPKAIYLYGSQAKGKAQPHSDIDIAVVFTSLNGESRLDMISNLLSIASKFEVNIEPNVLVDDGEYCRFSFLAEVMETGQLIEL